MKCGYCPIQTISLKMNIHIPSLQDDNKYLKFSEELTIVLETINPKNQVKLKIFYKGKIIPT